VAPRALQGQPGPNAGRMLRNVLIMAASGLVLFSKDFGHTISQVMCEKWMLREDLVLGSQDDMLLVLSSRG
jgi:hypothetical protein